jgi:hypothetical protein
MAGCMDYLDLRQHRSIATYQGIREARASSVGQKTQRIIFSYDLAVQLDWLATVENLVLLREFCGSLSGIVVLLGDFEAMGVSLSV